jgi:Na+-translocating ferredoxin:NAD+ oxidoreductase RnfC subunit
MSEFEKKSAAETNKNQKRVCGAEECRMCEIVCANRIANVKKMKKQKRAEKENKYKKKQK